MQSELRAHQAQALVQLREAIRSGKRRPMVQAPTGAGKTLMAAAIVEGARAKHNRVLFTVPALSLIDQTVEMFYREGIREVGVIQAQHHMTDWSQPVQIASVQTLMRRMKNGGLPDASMALVDEAHRWFDFYDEWMGLPEWRNKPIIGLSATPWTKGLGKREVVNGEPVGFLRYDDLIIAATTQELIDEGYLSPFRVFAPAHPDLKGVRIVAGDYHEGDLSKAMDKGGLVADVVETWKARGENRSTLCFGVDRAHAKHLQECFLAAGVPAEYMDMDTDLAERAQIKERFHSGETRVVCNVGVLTLGVDWDVRCLILARPTRSEILFVQIIGRALRTAEGKDNALILDHSDNHIRLGFVTDIHHEELNDGNTRVAVDAQVQERLPKKCPQCAFLKPVGVSVCPNCGFKPVTVNGHKHKDGELEELTATNKKTKAADWPMEQKLQFYGELKYYGAQHGYKAGWASNKYREKFGVWPARNAVECLPRPETVSWIRSRNIAWAKRQGRDEEKRV